MKDKELLIQFLKLIPRDIQNRKGFSFEKNNYHLLSSTEKYIMDIFNLYNRLNELYKDLERVIIFIKRYPTAKYYESNNIDKLAYIKYHTEVYLHKIHTILEVMKLILNDVYELEIAEKDCTWNKLKNNSKVNQTKAYKIIELFHKSFEKIIDARHRNTHRALFNSGVDMDLEAAFDIYKLSNELDLGVDLEFMRAYPPMLVNYELKLHRKKRVDFIQKSNEAAIHYYDMFINEILRVAIMKYSEKVKEK